jgi:hypothetical protein
LLQTTIYLLNVHDAGKTTSETPFFCYSHLIMKLAVSPAGEGDATRIPNMSGNAQLEQNAGLPPALLQVPCHHTLLDWRAGVLALMGLATLLLLAQRPQLLQRQSSWLVSSRG